MLSSKKILFTGATGQAMRPAAETLARDNEVWCVARFTKPEIKRDLEAKGVSTYRWTMGLGDLDGLPADFTHVVHAAPYRGQPDSDTAAQANAVGAGMLMHHCRTADAFLFVSTFAVYRKPPAPDYPVSESDPLGGHAPYAPSYPVGKMAAEGAVRAFARVLGLRATIARLNVCYGPTGWGGLPVEYFARIAAGEPIWLPTDGSDIYSSPISTDDVTTFLPALFDIASTSTSIVNLAGDGAVSHRQFCTYLAGKAGLDVRFTPSEESRAAMVSDNTRRRALLGDCQVHWKDGFVRAVEAHFPCGFSGTDGRAGRPVEANIWNQR